MAPKMPTPPAVGIPGCSSSPKSMDKNANVGGTVSTTKNVTSDGIAGTETFPVKNPSQNRPA